MKKFLVCATDKTFVVCADSWKEALVMQPIDGTPARGPLRFFKEGQQAPVAIFHEWAWMREP